MTLERMLTDTLHAADGYAPSSDLFAKVRRSIEEDRAHRRRIRETVLWLAAAAGAVAVFLTATVRVEDGRIRMSFTSLEILVTAVMIGIVAVMGPAIRRFGRSYEQAVFAGSPATGAHVLRLLDIAYYLIFGAYVVMTLMFEPPRSLPLLDRQFSDMVRLEAARLGGLFLLMGLLHVVLLIGLPVAGLVHSANLRRARIAGGDVGTDDGANAIDRGVTVGVWIGAAFVVFEMVGLVAAVLLVLGNGL